MTIDNPRDEIRKIVGDDSGGLFGALIQSGGLFSPILPVMSIANRLYSSDDMKHRCYTAIRALCEELDRIDNAKTSDWSSTVNSEWFKKALRVLIDESIRAVSDERAVELAVATANGCFPSQENKHRREDLASYIHDLARLGADDIQMLKLLRNSYKDVIKNDPNLRDPNRFTNHNDGFRQAADELNIHPDDRLSLGARLSGFGLAFESVPQQESRFFRPTRRGIYLLSLLEAANVPREKAN